MNLVPGTPRQFLINKCFRGVGAAILLIAAIFMTGYAIKLVVESFGNPSVDLGVPIAYVAYCTVMVQVAFSLVRRFKTTRDVLLRYIVLLAGLFAAGVPMFKDLVDLPPFFDRPEFLIVSITFFVTIWNMAVEGFPRQGRDVAWMWETNPWPQNPSGNPGGTAASTTTGIHATGSSVPTP